MSLASTVRSVDLSGVEDLQGQSSRQNSKNCVCKGKCYSSTFCLRIACFMVVRMFAVLQPALLRACQGS